MATLIFTTVTTTNPLRLKEKLSNYAIIIIFNSHTRFTQVEMFKGFDFITRSFAVFSVI